MVQFASSDVDHFHAIAPALVATTYSTREAAGWWCADPLMLCLCPQGILLVLDSHAAVTDRGVQKAKPTAPS